MKVQWIFLIVVHGVFCRRLPASADVDNDINGPPSNTFRDDWVSIYQPPKAVITRAQGTRLELECEAIGMPPPTIQWMKRNTPLTENENYDMNTINELPSRGMAKVKARLVINSVLSVHEGTFTCLAQSGPKTDVATSKLYVTRNHGAPQNFSQLLAGELLAGRAPARIVLHDVVLMENIGTDVILPCQTVGNPRPEVMWLDNMDRVLGNGQDPRISILGDDGLRIQGIRWSDMGGYTCVATNAVGQDTASTFLYPMSRDK